MTPSIDMSDRNAWDDSLLIDSWNDALTEYKKYHSIHKSGKRLEDVLTAEELKELRDDYGDLIDDGQSLSEAPGIDCPADEGDAEMSLQETDDDDHDAQARMHLQKSEISEKQEQGQPLATETDVPHDAGLVGSMPQALLGTVQDENLKNIMMSWYYAGYYTGLHAGQQQALQNTTKE
ncbi:hypothetical protein ACN47E_004737 [Coniothyrium glycines]